MKGTAWLQLPSVLVLVLLLLIVPRIYDGASPEINELAGQIFSINVRGVSVYVTLLDFLILRLILPFAAVAALVCNAISFLSGRNKNGEG